MAKKKIEIRVRCTGAAEMALSELTPLQGQLKTLTKESFEKLKQSLSESGFLFPFFVWRAGTKNYYIDGHQRDRVLRELAKDKSYVLPAKYPVAFIEAADKKAAARALLLQSSRYGRISDNTLADFVDEFALDFEELATLVELPDVGDLGKELLEAGDPLPGTQGETPADRLVTYAEGAIKQIVLYFDGKEYESVMARLQKVAAAEKKENNTEAFIHLLTFYEKNKRKKG